jgi:hypothetical protein
MKVCAGPYGDDDSEVIAAAEQAEQDATGEHVVGFGCQKADRVFLAAVPGQRHRHYNLTIPECPGCGGEHIVLAQPRPRSLTDEIAIQVEAPRVVPETGDDGPGRRQVSDQMILDAIPAGAAHRLVTVAAKLEYSTTTPLMRRVRRMISRAEEKGETPPLKLTKLAWRGFTVERTETAPS